MLGRKALKLSKYLPNSAIIWVSAMAGFAGIDANAQTAGDVLNRMTDDERFAYVTGVIEGLAAARWAAEQPDSSGMACIYDWYFADNDEKRLLILTWLENNPEQRVGFLMHVLTQRECPNE